MSITWAPRNSEPAAATRPRIVSISGSPAATSEPKASTRMPRVTGQEISSDFIIAVLLASLKSDHMPGAPVRLTSTPSPSRGRGQLVLEVVRRADHLVGVLGGPGLHDGGVTVVGDRHSRARRHDGGHGVARAQDALDLGHRGPELRVAGGRVLRVDDHHQPVGAEAMEVAIHELARLDGLRSGGLPAGARQRVLDPGREHPQADRHHDPGGRHRGEMLRRPAAESPDRAHAAHRAPCSRSSSAAAWRWMPPHTCSHRPNTSGSAIA